MVSREIEKEIRQENKVVLNLTVRQLVCVAFALLCSVTFAVVLRLDFDEAVYPSLFVGAACFAFGWYRREGLFLEELILRRLESGIYRNRVRCYRTMNGYTRLFNQEYARRGRIDARSRKRRRHRRLEEGKRKKKKGSLTRIR